MSKVLVLFGLEFVCQKGLGGHRVYVLRHYETMTPIWRIEVDE